MNPQDKISVVLVDDSSVVRGALMRILKDDPHIQIVGTASNGQLGIDIATQKKPDILILDVEMPVMDGLTALPLILKASPETKILMCSTLTEKGAHVTLKALSLGAVDSIVKPTSAQDTGLNSEFQRALLETIKTLYKSSQAHRALNTLNTPKSTSITALAIKPQPTLNNNPTAYKGKPAIIAIGSSTGGPNALFSVLKNLKGLDVPIVITQHMPATFTKILAEHINNQTGIPTHEAEEGMNVENGHIYVARGGKHMVFYKDTNQLKIKLDDGPQENFCKPAVDTMLRSLIDIYGQKTLCVILTGMGQDGLKSAKILVEKGGRVIAQDEKTSVVWGMPGAVAMQGLCSAILPIDDIGPWIIRANRNLI